MNLAHNTTGPPALDGRVAIVTGASLGVGVSLPIDGGKPAGPPPFVVQASSG